MIQLSWDKSNGCISAELLVSGRLIPAIAASPPRPLCNFVSEEDSMGLITSD